MFIFYTTPQGTAQAGVYRVGSYEMELQHMLLGWIRWRGRSCPRSQRRSRWGQPSSSVRSSKASAPCGSLHVWCV